jgi:hypothetical protein
MMPAKCVLLTVVETELIRTRVSEKTIDRQTDALLSAPARLGSDAPRERLDLRVSPPTANIRATSKRVRRQSTLCRRLQF